MRQRDEGCGTYSWREAARGLVIVVMILLGTVLPVAAQQDREELVLLTWSDYLAPELVSAFEAECDCKIRQVYFETDDFRDELMLDSEGAGFDVICVNGLMLDRYRRRNWLAPLPPEGLQNLAHINPRWQHAFDKAPGYAVPYFWGTMGIAYRQDLVAEPITSWKQLFEPDDALKGKIALIRSARDLLTAALKAAGYSLNSTDADALREAEQLLLAQKPHVFSYTYISLSPESTLATGEVVASVAFNGDAVALQEHNPDIVFTLPEEGGELWVDYLTVSRQSERKALAWQFIDFVNRPENAAANAQFVYYATANLTAEKHLPADFLADPVIYPDAEALRKSEFYRTLPPRVERRYSEIYDRVVD